MNKNDVLTEINRHLNGDVEARFVPSVPEKPAKKTGRGETLVDGKVVFSLMRLLDTTDWVRVGPVASTSAGQIVAAAKSAGLDATSRRNGEGTDVYLRKQ